MKSIIDFFHHFFIPNKENGYKARSLHINMLSLYLVIAISLVFLSKTTPFFSQVLGIATDITIEKLLEYTNEERTSKQLPLLSLNTQLTRAAQLKAENMFQKDYWAHFAPDGATPWDFIKKAGYSYEYAGENLAKNFLFSKNVINAWMGSPTHRENLLQKNFSEVGFAIVNGVLNGEETTLVVQMFGSPSQVTPLIPQATEHTKPQILGKRALSSPPVVGSKISFNINVIFILFIGVAIILDLFVAARLNIVHLGSKHIAHLLFILFIGIGILFVLKSGAIL